MVPSTSQILGFWNGFVDPQQSKSQLLERHQHSGEVLLIVLSHKGRHPKSVLSGFPVSLVVQKRFHRRDVARPLLVVFLPLGGNIWEFQD